MKPEAFAVRDTHLFLSWKDVKILLDGMYLRASCRCAECRSSKMTGVLKITAPDEIVRPNAALQAITPMGYGLQLHFSDGHNRGIYPWRYLRELAQNIA
jgi:DUF971 family protein